MREKTSKRGMPRRAAGLRAGAIPLQRPAEKKNRRPPPRKSPLTGGESCDKIEPEAKTRRDPHEPSKSVLYRPANP